MHPFLVVLALSAQPASLPSGPDAWDGQRRVVHEWGTFTGVSGADGVALGGLRHHDRDLPPFVYDLARRMGLTACSPKMETPVVYFYAPDAWRVRVDVAFPRGLVTQWWPSASRVNRLDGGAPVADPLLRDGAITWGRGGELTVLAPGARAPLAPLAPEDPFGCARDVAANLLRVRAVGGDLPEEVEVPAEHERFLFYRGLGDFPLPLTAAVGRAAAGERGLRVDLRLENPRSEEPLTHVVLIQVDGARAGFVALPDVAGRVDLRDLEVVLAPRDEVLPRLAEHVARELAATALYEDEARAMAATWAHAWFGDEGLRVLCVLPRAFVERELPLSVRGHASGARAPGAAAPEPDPDAVERVFVARLELLTPGRERELERLAEDLARGPDAARADARARLERWGRFAAPFLERARSLARSDAVRRAIDAELARLARG